MGMWGLVMLIISTLLLFALGAYFIIGSLAFGSWISKKVIKFKEHGRQEMLLNFGIGLALLLFVVRYLIMVNLFFSVITWLIFIALWVFIYLQRKQLKLYKVLIQDMLGSFNKQSLKKNRWKYIGLVLIVFSIMYYFYGFQLSFIPYSTAWDANHAYMYLPKVWSLNNGAFWSNGPGSGMVGLWHAFIAFWFSLFKPLSWWFWLSADTVAVSMNFLSGLLVMFFWLGLTKEVIWFFNLKEKDNAKKTMWRNIAFYIGWFVLLLRLTSGMGAFLVFVDNKTDLGVMAMTILALLSGFIFLRQVVSHDIKTKLNKESIKYIIISWALFVLATVAKPTAFVDMALFGLLLIGVRFGVLFSIWGGISLVWLLWILRFGNMKDFMPLDSVLPYVLLIVWLVVMILGLVVLYFKKKWKNYWIDKKRLLSYLGIWVLASIGAMLVAKWPGVLYNQVINNSFSPSYFVKRMIFSYQAPSTLLADTGEVWALEEQNEIDRAYLKSSVIPVSQCLQTSYTEEELEKDLRAPISSNEDVGRYVGYWWKSFDKPDRVFRLGYGMLRFFFPGEGSCYGWNKGAKLLCANKSAVDTFDVEILKSLLSQIPEKSEAYSILHWTLDSFEEQGFATHDPQLAKLMRDEVVELRQFYQSNSILTKVDGLNVPYRYIVPLNIVYNRSLQNLSSYYTDIGFVWLFAFVFIILALIHSLIRKNNQLAVLNVVTLIWRIIWWLIGWWILRYGIGLIMWTVLVIALWTKELLYDSDDDVWTLLVYVMLGLFVLRWLTQLIFNFARISSQGAWWPFVRYKMNTWKITEISKDLQSQQVLKYGYNAEDVLNLQFPHYNKFIEHTKDRPEEDGVLIAGTYMQYFLDVQNNLVSDGMLGKFWKLTSDNDSCKSYHRIKNENIKYLVIDPNIWTVVMGEWNESLFHRFFAKIDPITWLIEDHGAISMLVRLRMDWYIKLYSTNNLGAKYAFSISDVDIKKAFGASLNEDQLLFIRAQLSIARFFPNSQQLMGFIANTFAQRVQNGLAIGDIADIYGKVINEQAIFTIAKKWLEKQATPQQIQSEIETLSQDERFILSQYLAIFKIIGNQQQFQSMVNQLIKQSLGGTSQLMVFELIE